MINKTGRVFECLSKKGPETSLMADYFIIGKNYLEADKDILDGNQCDDTAVLLYSEYITIDGYSVPIYVDLMDFEHVANRTEIVLN